MSSTYFPNAPQANCAREEEEDNKKDCKQRKTGLLAKAFAPGLSISFMAALLSLSSMPAQAVTCAVQLEFENSVNLADGTTPTSTGFAVWVGTFKDRTTSQVASLISSTDVATNRSAILTAFSLFASTSVGYTVDDPVNNPPPVNDGFISRSLSADLGTVTTSSATSPFYVLVANNAVITSATQFGIFLHTGGGTVGSVKFPANDTSALSFDISPSFNLTTATAIFGSQDASGDGVFILGDLSKSSGITSASTATFNVGVNQTFTIQTNFGADNFTIFAGSLPAGFNLNTATGELTGTAASSGTFNLTIRATNLRSSVQSDQNLTLNLVGGLSIDSALTVQAVRGKAFSYTITANQIADSFGATIPANASWLTRNGAVLSGTPPAGQTAIAVPISATKDGTTDGKTLRINFRNPTLTGSADITKRLGEAVSYPLTLEAGVTGVFTATGLPYGLSIDPTTGTISGRAFAEDGTANTSDCGDKPIVAKLSDSNGNELTTFSFAITLQTKLPEISSLGPIVGSVGNPLSYPITISSPEATVSNGLLVVPTEDSNYQLFRNIGLTLANGIISGTPLQTAQPFKIKLRANNTSSGAPGAGFGNEVEIEIGIDVSPIFLQPEYTLYYRVGQHVNGSADYPNEGAGFYLSGSIPPGITNKLPLGTGFSGTPSSPGSYTSAITYSKLGLNGNILQAVQPVKIRVNRGTQAFYGMDGNLDGGPAGRTLTGQVAGYFSDRFDRPNSSVKVSTGSGLVHSNPQTEVVDQFSLSLWFKMPETPIPASGAYLIKGNPSVDAVSIKLIPSTTSSRVRLVFENLKPRHSPDDSGLFSGNQFTTPEIEGWSAGSGWHHIVFKSSWHEQIYLDGVGLSQLGYWYFNFAPPAFDLNNFSIGGNLWSADNAPFAGEIDEVGVYDIPLEESDHSLDWDYGEFYAEHYNPLGDHTVESLYLHGLANTDGGKLTVFRSEYHLGYLDSFVPAITWGRIVDLDVGGFTISGLDSNGRPMLSGHYPSFRLLGYPSLGVPPPSIVSGVAELRSGTAWHLALKKDATAFIFGWLGSYSDQNQTIPHQVSLKSSNAVALAAGLNHAMILKTDGSLEVWHPLTEPNYWFLPEPEATFLGQTSVPAAATHLVAIAAGSNHCVALDREGRVFAWGDNSTGQCDVPIAAQANIVKIAAGGDLSMALTRDGRVLFWGLQDVAVGSPEALQGKYRFIDVGDNGSLGALSEDGRLVTWLRGTAEMQRIWDEEGVSQFLPSYGGFSGISRFKMGGRTFGSLGSAVPVILQANNVPSWKMNFPLKFIGRPGVPFSFELSSVADLPPGQTHRFEAIGLPYGVVLDPASGILSAPNGLPTQGQTVTFVVRNDNGLDRRSVSLQAEDPIGIQLLACNPQESQNTVLLATLRLPAGWQLSPISVVQPYVAREVYGGWEIWSRAGLDYENPQERTVNVSVSATDPLGGLHSTSAEVVLLNDPWEDADGDTVREYFEELYGSSDQLSDTDGDGVSDWQEIQAGTSPKNPAVRPGSGSTFGDNHNGKFRFRFHAGIGKWVTVQSSEDLINWSSETLSEGEWAELYPGFEGDGEIWEAEFPISSGKQFYRTQQTNFRPVSR